MSLDMATLREIFNRTVFFIPESFLVTFSSKITFSPPHINHLDTGTDRNLTSLIFYFQD